MRVHELEKERSAVYEELKRVHHHVDKKKIEAKAMQNELEEARKMTEVLVKRKHDEMENRTRKAEYAAKVSEEENERLAKKVKHLEKK